MAGLAALGSLPLDNQIQLRDLEAWTTTPPTSELLRLSAPRSNVACSMSYLIHHLPCVLLPSIDGEFLAVGAGVHPARDPLAARGFVADQRAVEGKPNEWVIDIGRSGDAVIGSFRVLGIGLRRSGFEFREHHQTRATPLRSRSPASWAAAPIPHQSSSPPDPMGGCGRNQLSGPRQTRAHSRRLSRVQRR